jgi:hypothetical protein
MPAERGVPAVLAVLLAGLGREVHGVVVHQGHALAHRADEEGSRRMKKIAPMLLRSHKALFLNWFEARGQVSPASKRTQASEPT